MTRPIGIDLFAGAGGMALGFEQAGFDIKAAVEMDPIHAAVHNYNFPNCHIIARSVVGLSGNEIRRVANIGSRQVDVVFGGPPCQGFSLIGKRALKDPRNRLVEEFARLVAELDAKYFVFENVKGITVGKHRNFLSELIRKFKDHGYHIKQPWKLLNANSFGIPQNRERLFILGAKIGDVVPEYPSPTSYPADRTAIPNLAKGPSCEQALSDLPNADNFVDLKFSDETVIPQRKKQKSRYARQLRCENDGDWKYGNRRVWNREALTSSLRTVHSDATRKRFASTCEGKVEVVSRFFKLQSKGPCNTLRAGTGSDRGAFTSARPIHYKYPRCITVREMARLQSFPDWFRFHRTKWHGARQVGNSVPPMLAFAVADQIARALGVPRRRQTMAIKLGSADLLSYSAEQAAAYFGVPKPSAKRTRNKIERPTKEAQPKRKRVKRT